MKNIAVFAGLIFISSVCHAFGFNDVFKSHTATVQAEVNKAATVTKTALEAIATYKAQRDMERDAAKIQTAMKQTVNTCSAMAITDAIGKSSEAAGRVAAKASRDGIAKLESTASTETKLQEARAASQEYFSAADAAAGRGPVTNERFAGGDRDATFLYSSPDLSSMTYEPDQHKVVKVFIDRVIGNLPPENLHDANWERTQQGSMYLETLRRHTAVNSLARYSLNQIMAGHLSKADMESIAPPQGSASGLSGAISAMKTLLESGVNAILAWFK